MRTAAQRAILGETEAGLQATVIEWLTLKGYTFLQTTIRVRKCEHCGRYPTGGNARQGVTPGLADLLVWQFDRWVAVELKGPMTRVSPAQQDLADAGMIFICRSLEEVQEALEKASTL